MKIFTSIALIGLFFAQISNAEVVLEEIVRKGRKKWTASVVEGHMASQKTVCMAVTESKNARLEVYAEKSKHGNFVEPLVQIVLKDSVPVVGGSLLPNRSTKRYAVTVTTPENPSGETHQVLVAKYTERERLIHAIRAKRTLRLDLYNQEGRRVDRITFSLSGSSNAVKKQFSHCGLEVTR